MAFKLTSFKSPKQSGRATRTAADAEGGLRIPFLSNMPFARQLRILGFALLFFLVSAAVSAYLDNRISSQGTRYVASSSELLMLSQRLAKDALQALNGNYLAFDDMAQSRKQMAHILQLLDKGDATLPATSGSPRQLLDQVLKLGQKTEANIQAVVNGRPGLVTVRAAINANDTTNPEMRQVLQEMMTGMSGTNRQRVERLALLVERISKDSSMMLGNVTAKQVSSLGDDTKEEQDLLNALPATDTDVMKAKELFDSYQVSSDAIISNAQGLLGAKQAGREIFDNSDLVLEEAQALNTE